ncbi:hypothetical protein [Pedobacter sp. Leaf132]|uniref:hypothetical protein n=1 Tax=Pedobacter sp. Leaf132 TaxID=2876557 RepID=UPI001E5FF2D8|nr:hypothetical protein [Pedobacter sp. Leaf132]
MNVDDLIFSGAFGSKTCTVRLTAPHGGGYQYHIMIDDYYVGALQKRSGKWCWLNMPSSFTSADRDLLIARFQTKLDK